MRKIILFLSINLLSIGLSGQSLDSIAGSFKVPSGWKSYLDNVSGEFYPLNEIEVSGWNFETKNEPIVRFQYAIFKVSSDSLDAFEIKIKKFQEEYYSTNRNKGPRYQNFYYRNYYFMAIPVFCDHENKGSLILQKAFNKWIKTLK